MHNFNPKLSRLECQGNSILSETLVSIRAMRFAISSFKHYFAGIETR